MQEEVENRTINLAISTTRLTARSIIAGIRKYLQHREKVKARKGTRDTAVHGKQSVKQLLGQNQGATNVEIDKDGIRDFERLAKKYGVDFAVRKDKSVDPPRYLVFVRSKDADALDAICKEHQANQKNLKLKKTIIAVEVEGKMTYRAESGEAPTPDETCRINEAIHRAEDYGYNLRTISHRYFMVEKFYPIDFRKSSKNPIQKSKFFNLADMFGYKTMPDTEKIAADLNGRTWEEF